MVPVLVTMAMAACTSNNEKQAGADTIIKGDSASAPIIGEATSMCFLRTDGAGNKDTTSIELVIKEQKVSGQMYWHPFEKDSRKGTLSGALNGDTVNAVWSFMQEGTQDTLNLRFLIKGDNLMQKPLKLNPQTGREQTDDAAGFIVSYRPSVSLKKK